MSLSVDRERRNEVRIWASVAVVFLEDILLKGGVWGRWLGEVEMVRLNQGECGIAVFCFRSNCTEVRMVSRARREGKKSHYASSRVNREKKRMEHASRGMLEILFTATIHFN